MTQLELKQTSDIPSVASTSSIGAVVWPPESVSEERKKGIYPRVIETVESLRNVIEELGNLPFDAETTRYSARAFVSRNALASMDDLTRQSLDRYAEGFISLHGAGVSELQDCMIVYLGKNHETRTPPSENVNKELRSARRIFRRTRQFRERNYDNSYTFEQISDERRHDELLLKEYIELYSAFGWDADQVIDLVQKPTNTLVAAFHNGHLVSAGMAERGELLVERNGQHIPVVIYEITEAATREEYRGNGLYTHIAQELLRTLAQSDVNIAYAESNLAALAVLRSARNQGRRSTLSHFKELGLTPRPLIQAVRISGGVNDRRPSDEKNDLLVTYIDRRQLRREYGINGQ